MKKKILLFIALLSIMACFFAIGISAETPTNYIEFGARFPGSDEYITVYTQNAENTSHPRIDFANCKFYSDVDFTQEVDMSTVTGIDFSVSKTYANGVQGIAPNRMVKPKEAFVNCTEVKWFTQDGAMDYTTPSSLFKDWSSLKTFDFGNLKKLGDNSFEGCGFEELVIPSTITHLYSRTFAKNAKLTSVKFEGPTELAGNACAFAECTALESVELGNVSYIGTGTFSGCTALASIKLPSNVTEIKNSAFSGCTALTTVDMSDVTKLVSIDKYVFSGCSSLSKIISSGIDQEGAVIIPEGVTHIYQEAFYNCDSIKYLSLPSTITYLGPSVIRDSTGLEFVDFNDNPNDINLDNWGHFNGCSALKAVSLPDGLKTINNRFMTYCTSLKAVYLPVGLVQMNTNGNGQGPFCFSAQMYFVQEAFEVRGANGYFLGDSFNMPQKPEIYFMPSTLSKAGGNVDSGTWFRGCASLNNVIVMPEAFTESTVVQMFRETASATQRKTVVYLGKITNYAWSEMNKYIDFVFANPGNTDLSTITFTSFYNRNNENCYFYFCSTGYRYTMAKASVADVAATKEENQYCHVKEKTLQTEADCVNPKMLADYCFCGAIIGTPQTEGEALGHDLAFENGAIDLGIAYIDYFQNGIHKIDCARCDHIGEVKTDALFESLGYSACTYSKGLSITQGFKVNNSAIEAYKAYAPDFTFGVLATVNSEGEAYAPSLESENVVSTEFAKLTNNYVDIKVKGIPADKSDALIVLCAYVKVSGKTYFLDNGVCGETVVGISYNEANN